MRIGILCACDDELAPFLPAIEECETISKAKLTFYKGKIGRNEVIALYSGVCKVNAAIAAQLLIETFGVDAVINAGVAGGMDPALKIFDTVIGTESAYHDMTEDILTDFHPWLESVFIKSDPRLLELSHRAVEKLQKEAKQQDLPGHVYWGRMVTGENFIADEGREEINDKFAPLAVDMETAGIAHVCYVFGVPFLSIRSITDTADHSGMCAFEENCKKASSIAKDITLALLEELE